MQFLFVLITFFRMGSVMGHQIGFLVTFLLTWPLKRASDHSLNYRLHLSSPSTGINTPSKTIPNIIKKPRVSPKLMLANRPLIAALNVPTCLHHASAGTLAISLLTSHPYGQQ